MAICMRKSVISLALTALVSGAPVVVRSISEPGTAGTSRTDDAGMRARDGTPSHEQSEETGHSKKSRTHGYTRERKGL